MINKSRNNVEIILNTLDDPYAKLGCAIVLRAVNDYRIAVRELKKHPDNYNTITGCKARRYLKCCEQFFRSDWYELLFGDVVEGEMIIKTIRDQERWDGIYES